MNYFNKAVTVADIKHCYRQLAMKYHPDRPDGNTEVMQAINEQYQQALQHANGEVTTDNEGRSHTYRYK